ncbi:MAG: hypothetical protein HY808_11420 [Nitrospirae bacterium]|nr:hypothetical protein [Nitrospirota bacterium]
MESALSQLKNITPFCVECSQYTNSIENLFSIYQKSDSMVNDLQVIGGKLEEITNRIANGERPKINSFINKTQRNLRGRRILQGRRYETHQG